MAVIAEHVRGDGQVESYGSTERIRVGRGLFWYLDADGIETIGVGEHDDPDPEAVAWTLDSLVLNEPLDVASGGTGLDAFTAGDTFYFAVGDAFTKVPIGAQHTIYASTGSAPGWVTNINAAALPTGNVAWNFGADNAVTLQGQLVTSASTATRAGVLISPGAAPTGGGLVDGAFWMVNATGWFGRRNGVTEQFLAGTITVGQGGTGISSYTVGDMIYASGTTTLAKLAVGATGQIIRVSGGNPTYSTATYPNTVASGRLLYASATDTVSGLSGMSSSNVILLGSSTVPSWVANIPYGALPTGSGNWNAGAGTITFDSAVEFAGTVRVQAGGLLRLSYRADPASPGNGDIWINSTTFEIKYRANGVTYRVTAVTP